MLDPTFELLKDCNLKLDELQTPHFRFAAWITYSVQHGCFIAGVDAYSNNEQDTPIVVLKSADALPRNALDGIADKVTEWHNAGEVEVEV